MGLVFPSEKKKKQTTTKLKDLDIKNHPKTKTDNPVLKLFKEEPFKKVKICSPFFDPKRSG